MYVSRERLNKERRERMKQLGAILITEFKEWHENLFKRSKNPELKIVPHYFLK